MPRNGLFYLILPINQKQLKIHDFYHFIPSFHTFKTPKIQNFKLKGEASSVQEGERAFTPTPKWRTCPDLPLIRPQIDFMKALAALVASKRGLASCREVIENRFFERSSLFLRRPTQREASSSQSGGGSGEDGGRHVILGWGWMPPTLNTACPPGF